MAADYSRIFSDIRNRNSRPISSWLLVRFCDRDGSGFSSRRLFVFAFFNIVKVLYDGVRACVGINLSSIIGVFINCV